MHTTCFERKVSSIKPARSDSIVKREMIIYCKLTVMDYIMSILPSFLPWARSLPWNAMHGL